MENNILDLGSLDFTPAWAKKDEKVTVAKGARAPHEPADRSVRAPGDKKPMVRKDRRFDKPREFVKREVVKPLAVEVKILPETKALGTIIRKLQSDSHAYKLKELAYFFLDNPESVLLKITPKEGETIKFHSCKACGFASTKEDEVVEHLIAEHLQDYYTEEVIDCEPPKGNFSCVAKCGLSGVLIGPPNIHEFNSVVKELNRTKYPNMSESEYRSHIEMVRESEVIEEWRKNATKKTVYFAKTDTEKAKQLTREQAEGEFKRVIMSSMLDTPKSLMITADKALKLPERGLVYAVKDALRDEARAPYNMCFALRGAFHHRKLKFFRTNDAKGQEFVINTELKEFDATHAIPELAAAYNFIKDHPCSAKNEIVKDAEGEKQLNWLVSTGHVVAFTNGVYSAAEKFPKYGPQWRKAAKVSRPEGAGSQEPEVAQQQDVKVEDNTVEVKNEGTSKLAE